MRYRINLCYDGSAFFGWQRQNDAPTVQQALEEALSTLLKEDTNVVGAGRTDTAVNASYYVAHFDSRDGLDCADLHRRLNAILPEQIAVLGLEAVQDEFHARFGAVSRTYRYYVHRTKNPFLRSGSYLCAYPVLDFEAMNRAAQLLVGRHDFSCFEKTGADNRTSICTITEARWSRVDDGDDTRWVFTVTADRFLRNMVRAIVGTLIEVGRGKRSPGSVADLLAKGDRCAAGESVPGYALYLSDIRYQP